MPITYRSRDTSTERLYQNIMDWTRKLMQLSVVSTVLLYAYVLWGLFGGAVDSWVAADAANKARILGNIQGATLYLDISLGVLLLTLTIL